MNNYNFSNIISSLFPEALKGHPQYKVLIDLATQEFTKIDDFIKMMSFYSNIDRCPEEFLQHLADIIGFQYNKNLDDIAQRECMKMYMSEAIPSVGRPNDLINMATYGDVEGYLGGDLFVPGTKPDYPLATVTMARNRLYTHSKSQRSGTDVYPSEIFREGVILITVTRLNEVIMNNVEKVKPAGLLVVYQVMSSGGSFDYVTHTKSYYR